MASLRELRERRFLSQEDLAAKAGVSRSTVSEIESDRPRPRRWRTIKRLAKALGVDPSEIDIPGRSTTG